MASSNHNSHSVIPRFSKRTNNKNIKQGLKLLQFFFEKKEMEEKLLFWLPLRADYIMMKSFDKLDFAKSLSAFQTLET